METMAINILTVLIVLVLNLNEYLEYKREKINRNTNRRQLTAKNYQLKAKKKHNEN